MWRWKVLFILGNIFLHPEIQCYEKKLVTVDDSAAAEAPKDLHLVSSAVNQSRMMCLLLWYDWVDEVSIIHANVQYLPIFK